MTVQFGDNMFPSPPHEQCAINPIYLRQFPPGQLAHVISDSIPVVRHGRGRRFDARPNPLRDLDVIGLDKNAGTVARAASQPLTAVATVSLFIAMYSGSCETKPALVIWLSTRGETTTSDTCNQLTTSRSEPGRVARHGPRLPRRGIDLVVLRASTSPSTRSNRAWGYCSTNRERLQQIVAPLIILEHPEKRDQLLAVGLVTIAGAAPRAPDPGDAPRTCSDRRSRRPDTHADRIHPAVEVRLQPLVGDEGTPTLRSMARSSAAAARTRGRQSGINR